MKRAPLVLCPQPLLDEPTVEDDGTGAWVADEAANDDAEGDTPLTEPGILEQERGLELDFSRMV